MDGKITLQAWRQKNFRTHGHQPQCHWWLVNGYGTKRVKTRVPKVLDALKHAGNRDGIKVVGGTDFPNLPTVQEGCQQ